MTQEITVKKNIKAHVKEKQNSNLTFFFWSEIGVYWWRFTNGSAISIQENCRIPINSRILCFVLLLLSQYFNYIFASLFVTNDQIHNPLQTLPGRTSNQNNFTTQWNLKYVTVTPYAVLLCNSQWHRCPLAGWCHKIDFV